MGNSRLAQDDFLSRRTRTRKLARARALAGIAFLDEAEHASNVATERHLVEEAIRQFLRGAAGLDQELAAGRRRAA